MIPLRLKLYLYIGAAFILGVLGVRAKWISDGERKARADAKQEELEGYVETRERMDEIGRMSDADAARDWLRERGKH